MITFKSDKKLKDLKQYDFHASDIENAYIYFTKNNNYMIKVDYDTRVIEIIERWSSGKGIEDIVKVLAKLMSDDYIEEVIVENIKEVDINE